MIAPDLPGYGQSDVLPSASFAAFSNAISELLDHLAIKRRVIYLHDSGAAVGLLIAMHAPELASGLVIQNANAHRTDACRRHPPHHNREILDDSRLTWLSPS